MSKRPPCIRGLKQFSRGCPMRPWSPTDTGGCPAWVAKEIPTKDGKRAKVAECLDHYTARLMWHNNALLEGNQQAIESFRNNTAHAANEIYQLASAKKVKQIGDS